MWWPLPEIFNLPVSTKNRLLCRTSIIPHFRRLFSNSDFLEFWFPRLFWHKVSRLLPQWSYPPVLRIVILLLHVASEYFIDPVKNVDGYSTASTIWSSSPTARIKGEHLSFIQGISGIQIWIKAPFKITPYLFCSITLSMPLMPIFESKTNWLRWRMASTTPTMAALIWRPRLW